MTLQPQHISLTTMPNRGEILKQKFFQSYGLPWQHILPESRLEELLEAENITYRNCIYTPVVTFWAMISQVLSADKSLRTAVKQMNTWLRFSEVDPASSDTGAYSKARQRFPEGVLQQLIPDVAEELEDRVPAEHQWYGRRVRVCDGTTILMSDSAANQADYPQHGNQTEGCGFPIAKLVVFFSLLTGSVVAASIAPWKTSEIVISRDLYSQLDPGDVLVADQAYGSYVDLAQVQQQQADAVFRKHHARHTDFRRGRKQGERDHQVLWEKPKQRPEHMSPEEFEAIPDTLWVREVVLRIPQPGYRDQRIIVVTTLLDAQQYTAEKLTQLYGYRWQAAEINLRHLKTTLKMEMLTAKTPRMVRKELWTHLLAYNLIRTVMEKASPFANYARSRLSFQGTRQQFNTMLSLCANLGKTVRKRLYQHLLSQIAADLLPVRPDRHEPRVVKRRPKAFARMKQPRAVLKAKIAA
jgi:Transposase DDE domain